MRVRIGRCPPGVAALSVVGERSLWQAGRLAWRSGECGGTFNQSVLLGIHVYELEALQTRLSRLEEVCLEERIRHVISREAILVETPQQAARIAGTNAKRAGQPVPTRSDAAAGREGGWRSFTVQASKAPREKVGQSELGPRGVAQPRSAQRVPHSLLVCVLHSRVAGESTARPVLWNEGVSGSDAVALQERLDSRAHCSAAWVWVGEHDHVGG